MARFTVILEGISEAELPSSGGRGYEWQVEGRPSRETGQTIRGKIPQNYAKDTMTATVKLVITTPKLERIEGKTYTKTVKVKRKPRKVNLGPRGAIEDRVGATVTLYATVDGSPTPPAGTRYGYYWSVNNTFRKSGVNMDRYSFMVPREGLRAVKTVSVLVKELPEGEQIWQDVGSASFDFSGYAKGKVEASRKRRSCDYPDNSEASCAQYGRDGVAQYNENIALGCHYEDGYYWHNDEENHARWCRNTGRKEGATRDCKMREDRLDACASKKTGR